MTPSTPLTIVLQILPPFLINFRLCHVELQLQYLHSFKWVKSIHDTVFCQIYFISQRRKTTITHHRNKLNRENVDELERFIEIARTFRNVSSSKHFSNLILFAHRQQPTQPTKAKKQSREEKR